jgi:hypothetical protein
MIKEFVMPKDPLSARAMSFLKIEQKSASATMKPMKQQISLSQ